MGVRLKAYGYEISNAYDAVTAVNIARNFKPDLNLIRYFYARWRWVFISGTFSESCRYCRSPIIFITASKKHGLKERAMEMGAAGFFEKPYDAEQLVNTVSSLI